MAAIMSRVRLNVSASLLRHFSPVSYTTDLNARTFCSKSADDEFKLDFLDGEHKGIAVFRFNRPKALNAISQSFVEKFKETIRTLKFSKDIRAIILKSEVKGAFCVGADLKLRAQMQEHEVAPWVSTLRNSTFEFSTLGVPSIAALDGTALGGGLEIALSCDFRVAAKEAKLGLVETRLAIIPGGGGTQRLPRLVGESKAKELIFTAKVLTGQEAADIGLVNYAVEQNETGEAAYERALQLASEILPQGPIAVKVAKQAISRGCEVDLSSGLAIEEGCYAQVIPTKDRLEGLKAFKEKRKPDYKGE